MVQYVRSVRKNLRANGAKKMDVTFQLAPPEHTTKQTTYTFGLSTELKRWLFAHAERLDISAAQIVRSLLLSYRTAIDSENSPERA